MNLLEKAYRFDWIKSVRDRAGGVFNLARAAKEGGNAAPHSRWFRPIASTLCALVVFGLGCWLLDHQPPGQQSGFKHRFAQALTRASYDWAFDLTHYSRPDLSSSGVIIVYIDETSLKELNRSLTLPMSRAIHARLLDRLTREGAKAVVVDVALSDGLDENTDITLAEAIRANGHVVLGVDYNPTGLGDTLQSETPAKGSRLIRPFAAFAESAACLGVTALQPDSDFMVRQHRHHLDRQVPELADAPPSLSWATAQMLKLDTAKDPVQADEEHWVYYYGPPETVPHISYKTALDERWEGLFRNKVVFIGSRARTGRFVERQEQVRSPYSVLADQEYVFMPAAEVHATEYLNLQRGDWLRRPSHRAEIGILAMAAFVFSFGLMKFRPSLATGLAVIGVLTVALITQSVFTRQHVWFSWLIIIVVQIPCALLISIVCRSLEWILHRSKLEAEQRRADAQIREQAELLDCAQDAIIVHDLRWRPLYWNKSAEELYGWKFEDIQGKDLRSEVLRMPEAELLEALEQALSKGEWHGELDQVAKDGRRLIVQSSWTLVRDEEGKPKSVFVINTDVTEHKTLQAQLLRTQRMESIGTLAGGIAHDLNNVLTPIMMGIELLKLKASDDHTKKLLNNMATSARRGSDMVKQVLTFARGQSGQREQVQVKHLIKEMERIAKETFPRTIEFQVEATPVRAVLADATQMHQIILNLCLNARDAMPDGGRITIGCKNISVTDAEAGRFVGARPGDYVLLSVTDTGTGIPLGIRDRIFEPFFTTKEVGKGTGLGLSTVVTIIKNHGGFLDLQTEVGKGTTFRVYLPAAQAEEPPAEEQNGAQLLPGNGETLLVVDDEPAVLEVTKTMLTHHGYQVVTASHGADALALYRQYKKRIKLVLMDMMMPVMDGATAIRALKQEAPDLRVLAVSGLMQNDTLKEKLGGLEIPILPKPYASEKLLETVSNLLSFGTGLRRARAKRA